MSLGPHHRKRNSEGTFPCHAARRVDSTLGKLMLSLQILWLKKSKAHRFLLRGKTKRVTARKERRFHLSEDKPSNPGITMRREHTEAPVTPRERISGWGVSVIICVSYTRLFLFKLRLGFAPSLLFSVLFSLCLRKLYVVHDTHPFYVSPTIHAAYDGGLITARLQIGRTAVHVLFGAAFPSVGTLVL